MEPKNSKIKQNLSPRIAGILKQRYLLTASAVILLVVGLLVYFNFSRNTETFGATPGDYRSAASGNWDVASNWQIYGGGTWSTATTAPNSSNKEINIQSGHTITINSNVTADQVIVSAGGTLVNNSTLTVAAGTGDDLDVFGTFSNAGTVTLSGAATISFENGGIYRHAFTNTPGTIPTATWNIGSTCEISGYINNTTAPAGLQSFFNFRWNCPAQTGNINLNGTLPTVRGDMIIQSTNDKELQLSNGTATTTVNGSLIINGGFLVLSNGSSSTSSITVGGNYSQTSGTFLVQTGSGSTGTVRVAGNWSHTGGTITTSGNTATNAQIQFNGTSVQNFTASSNTISGNVDFTVNNAAILSLGTQVLTGRNFTVSAGGGIQIGSPDGITATGPTGNIQVSGLRNFNSGSDYYYNGTTTQQTGNGLPTNVRDLTINNSGNLNLLNTVAISGKLNLMLGEIITGSNEIQVTNTATTSVIGQSATSYVVGNLRRSVAGSGTYSFPIGTAAQYEEASLTLSSLTGVSTILATFQNTDPLLPAYPLTNQKIGTLNLARMLNYGYWTFTPNASPASGTFSVELNETGFSNGIVAAANYGVVRRNNPASFWQSIGTHSSTTQTVVGNTVTAKRSGLNTFGEFAIAYSNAFSFSNPVLISGVNKAINSIYRFEDVAEHVDAWVQILSFENGASVDQIDEGTTGYFEAWQPFINGPDAATSSVTWKITFKKADTSIDTTLSSVAATAVDVDGTVSNLKEFVESSNTSSYGKDPASQVVIANAGIGLQGTGPYTTFNLIDTINKEAMFQINYTNINTFNYRTGMINTTGSVVTRQYSIYFGSFFTPTVLPVELTSFTGTNLNGTVRLDWTTASEKDNDYFEIERSRDARNFTVIGKVDGHGNSNTPVNYSFPDKNPGGNVVYYRLKQTDFDGTSVRSKIINVNLNNSKSISAPLTISNAYPNPFTDELQFHYNSNQSGKAEVRLLQTDGKILRRESIELNEGQSDYSIEGLNNLLSGVYMIQIGNAGVKSNTLKVVKK